MTQQLEVGKTYTSVNGVEWFCIAVDDGIAHMRHADSSYSAAYAWRLNGAPLTLTADDYRIVFEPERGEVVLYGYAGASFGRVSFPGDTRRLTLPTLEGELATGTYTSPEGRKIKVEKL